MLWPIVLIVIAALYTALRHLEIAPGRGVDPREVGTVFFTSAVLSAAVTWALAAWLLFRPLDWLVTAGWLGVGAAALLALAIGFVGMPEIALGATITYAWWRPAPELLLWWALPIVVGCSAHWLMNMSRHGAWSEPAAYWKLQRRALAGLMRHVEPPGWGLRTLRGLANAAFTAPVVVWFVHSGSGWAGAAAAALIAADLWASDWALRNVMRPSRVAYRLARIGWLAVSMLLAAGPAGARLVRWWHGSGPGLVGALVVAVVFLVYGLLMHRKRKNRPTPDGLLRPLIAAVFLLRHALALVALAALWHPSAAVSASVLPILAAVFLVNLSGGFALGLASTAAQEAAQLVRFPTITRDALLGGWVYDRCLARDATGNIILVQILISLAMTTGQRAYFDAAGQALSLLEEEALPLLRDDWANPLHESVAAARAAYAAATG